MQADVWVLIDHRVGSATQAISLAERLGISFKVKNIKYNFLALLPNCLLGASQLHVDVGASSSLKNEPLPKAIISAGRRTASVALSLKKLDPNIKVIQIMKPFLPAKKFDLIILPQHDNYKPHTNNTFITIGALHNAQQKMSEAAPIFANNYPELSKFIALMIGGNTKQYKFSRKDAEELAASVVAISANHGMPVFISFSRRTPDEVKEVFRGTFEWPHIIYDPISSKETNPYYGMLASASFIITTADSISMCSEASASGKPLYIVYPKNAVMPKHRYLVQQLLDLEIARLLSPQVQVLESYEYVPLDETRKVAEYIKDNIL